MIFLSHSSRDKEKYVEYIANKIGKDRCIYDTFSFKSGENIIDEILKNLNKAELFVVFISENSLISKNVLFEIEKAKEKLDYKQIKKIFPIIIDDKITHKDKRISDWIRNNYNLKPILRPKIAHRRIIAKALEIRYELDSKLRNEKNIFTGRNLLIQKFEEKALNYEEELPNTYIASGIEKIGRYSFLKACFEKTNLIENTYQPPILELDDHESLEDFIIKMADLGFSEIVDQKMFLEKSVEDKVKIALTLIDEIIKYDERIFIKDKGAIVLPNGDIANWFKDIILKISEHAIFAISSKFRVNSNLDDFKNKLVSFSVPELSVQERKQLLSYCLKNENIILTKDEFLTISNLLTGYPEQVKYAVSNIKENGIKFLMENLNLLVNFNSDRVTILLRKYEEEEQKINFLALLSKFDYISVDFLLEIVQNDAFIAEIIKNLYDESIIEYIGISREYLRLNDAIRDYIARLNLNIPKNYKENLEKHVTAFLKTYKSEEKSGADFLFSLKEALLSGKEIDSSFLIPSHFLKTMIELYNNKKDYNQVINLADRVLENSMYLDDKILQDIRYYLCLSLIRIRSSRFLDEKNKIRGLEKDFLMGFYHRINGEPNKAISYFLNLLKKSPNSSKVKRELVQVYLNIEDYESAYEISKENYENYPNNPYHIQAYLKCIIKNNDLNFDGAIIERLLDNLNNISSKTAKEMYMRGKALYKAYCHNEKDEAIKLINNVIIEFPNSVHVFLEKFDILYKYGSIKEIEDTVKEFKDKCNIEINQKNNLYYHMQVRLEIRKGNKELARTFLNMIRNYPEDLCKRLEKQIDSM